MWIICRGLFTKDEYRPDFAEEMIKSNKEEPIDTAPCSVEDNPVCDI